MTTPLLGLQQHRRTLLEDHVHWPQRLGASVMINARWYDMVFTKIARLLAMLAALSGVLGIVVGFVIATGVTGWC